MMAVKKKQEKDQRISSAAPLQRKFDSVDKKQQAEDSMPIRHQIPCQS